MANAKAMRGRTPTIKQSEVSVERHSADGFTLSCVYAGHLQHKRYIGYGLREAKREFIAEVTGRKTS